MLRIPVMRVENPPTSAKGIKDFEAERGIILPTPYRDFLLVTNGGVPMLPAFPIRGFEASPVGLLQSFKGIGVSMPTEELAWGFDLYRGGLPEGIIPIAGDGGGSYVCLDLRKGIDRVAFWDHRHYWGTGEWREADLYHVADTFEEFLALLSPNPYQLG